MVALAELGTFLQRQHFRSWGTWGLWDPVRATWDQQKRYLCQMREARVGRQRVSSRLCVQLLPLSDGQEEHLIIHDRALYPLVSEGTVLGLKQPLAWRPQHLV